ncbi:hypothetical protein Avbf_00916 [Armadillidium vulgare]|nr:hypothetical protein Avbf_00916 [Armadillidium vulgare]
MSCLNEIQNGVNNENKYLPSTFVFFKHNLKAEMRNFETSTQRYSRKEGTTQIVANYRCFVINSALPLNHKRGYIVLINGCIPGMSHRIGQTFGRASEDCIALFTRQLEQRQARKESEERRAKSLPRMKSSRSRPYHIQEDNARSSYVSPPIPGYTGYIPHMKCTEVGIGRTYGAAARKGIQKTSNIL